mgnify:CR=1 FL=1
MTWWPQMILNGDNLDAILAGETGDGTLGIRRRSHETVAGSQHQDQDSAYQGEPEPKLGDSPTPEHISAGRFYHAG